MQYIPNTIPKILNKIEGMTVIEIQDKIKSLEMLPENVRMTGESNFLRLLKRELNRRLK